jgi:hypothetical protein
MAALIIAAIIIAIPFIIALFVKKQYAVSKEVVINKSAKDVYNYIRFVKNQDHYGVWALMDPYTKRTYRGVDGTEGFVSAWDSKNGNVGSGEQEIIKLTHGERIDLSIRFVKPFEGAASASISTIPVSDQQTVVQWNFESHIKYPMNIFLLVTHKDKIIGRDMSEGLSNLKGIMERN